MRVLTFRGFLARSLRELSGQSSLSFAVLAPLAETENPRLREPLLLYAVACNKTQRLLATLKSQELYSEYARLLMFLTADTLEETLAEGQRRLPARYRKVYQSYLSVRDRQKADDHTKQLMWQKTKRLQAKKRVSNYRVYTDLQLNPGNANVFLKYGDTAKVSLEVARRMLRYVEAAWEQGTRRRKGTVPCVTRPWRDAWDRPQLYSKPRNKIRPSPSYCRLVGTGLMRRVATLQTCPRHSPRPLPRHAAGVSLCYNEGCSGNVDRWCA